MGRGNIIRDARLFQSSGWFGEGDVLGNDIPSTAGNACLFVYFRVLFFLVIAYSGLNLTKWNGQNTQETSPVVIKLK